MPNKPNQYCKNYVRNISETFQETIVQGLDPFNKWLPVIIFFRKYSNQPSWPCFEVDYSEKFLLSNEWGYFMHTK